MSTLRPLTAAVAAVTLALSCAIAGAAPARTAAAPSLRELVGQRLMISFAGTTPSASLLQRIRRGEVGGVILFGGNVTGPPQLRRLVDRLQQAARDGGRPPLLVATDQEGGAIRRVPWAPPTLAGAALAVLGPDAVRVEGRRTGAALRAAGITVDLAPVADVAGPGSFLAAEQRALGTTPAGAGAAAVAFARGLADARVAATVKHFPGIGAATRNTDRTAVTIGGGSVALARALEPFRAAVAAQVPIVMLANAGYAALDGKPAAWSPAVQALLRHELGFTGVTITDALDAAAATRGALHGVGGGACGAGGSRRAARHRWRGRRRTGLRPPSRRSAEGGHPRPFAPPELRPDPRAEAGASGRAARATGRVGSVDTPRRET